MFCTSNVVVSTDLHNSIISKGSCERFSRFLCLHIIPLDLISDATCLGCVERIAKISRRVITILTVFGTCCPVGNDIVTG